MRSLNLEHWHLYTSDKWILETIQGYKIEFTEPPFQFHIPNEIPFSDDQAHLVDQEVESLLQKGAIELVSPSSDQFLSTIFIVPKKDGSFRPVINLRYLNHFVQYHHFKQENLTFALDLIQRNDFMTKMDLKDAYFHIKIDPKFKKFLCFSWRGLIYSFCVLPFGLASAPRIFSKVLRPIYATFRQNGIRCCYYIDDSLLMNQDKTKCLEQSDIVSNEMTALGFTINEKKSVFVPTQRLEFFGVIIDTVLFMVFLPDDKIKKILHLCKSIITTDSVSIRVFCSLIGLLVHAFNAVLVGPLHYRALERDKVRNLAINNNNFDALMCPSIESVNEMKWWLDNLENSNGKLIRPNPIDLWLETDASSQGWGCYWDQNFAGGRWSVLESTYHINYLELLAMFMALKSFFKTNTQSLHIGIRSDNCVAIAYLNQLGGMCSVDMDRLASEIWHWSFERNIYLTAQYLPGTENIFADFMSRQFSDSGEWSLKTEIFERICVHFFMPSIDLFASRLNFKLKPFVSWHFDPEAQFIDAFSVSWRNLEPYIFPPFNLIAKILAKIMSDEVQRAIIVVPLWPTQSWFPVLMSCLVYSPARLPRHRDLVTRPHTGECHPLKKMNMIACFISGVPSRNEEFQLSRPLLLHQVGDRPLTNNTSYAGNDGFVGVINGRQISCTRLKYKS